MASGRAAPAPPHALGTLHGALGRGGRLHMEERRPFLVVARARPGRRGRDVAWLAFGVGSFLISDHPEEDEELRALAAGVATDVGASFGAFLLLEVWVGQPARSWGGLPPRPRFDVHPGHAPPGTATLLALVHALRRVRVGRRAEVHVAEPGAEGPPDLPPLLAAGVPEAVRWLGLEVRPVWREEGAGPDWPEVRRALRRGLTRALARALFAFASDESTHRLRHPEVLGRTVFTEAGRAVDRRLAALQRSHDFLLEMTPINAERAYASFQRRGSEQDPLFHYRPLPVDPDLLRRRLYRLPIERMEDPTLADLFTEKRRELDLRAAMLQERGRPAVRHLSALLYGEVAPDLLAAAEDLLGRLEPPPYEEGPTPLPAPAIAAAAKAELARYRAQDGELPSRVRVRADFPGIMVSGGDLLVGASVRVDPRRLDALLHHEIGTHVVTWANGRSQPFEQLAAGLAGYEELQEGLAVLSEHLCGGLTASRLRLLAGRVLAVHAMQGGAAFVETWRLLARGHGFSAAGAFSIALRVHRGGGLAKDAMYLRGLLALLAYLREGGALEPLFVGKIAAHHLPIVAELERRGVLVPPVLRPRVLGLDGAAERVERLRRGVGVLDLVAGGAR